MKKLLDSIERFEGLNALDVGSPKYKEYMKIMQELSGSHDAKMLKDTEYSLQRLGLKLGVAVTFNPSPLPPLDTELKYAKERKLTIELCEDGYYRWFKQISTETETAIDIEWTGPYAWPKFETESNLPAIPKHPGVYLWTSAYENGYIIYAAGITRRSIPERFCEHTQKYLSGDYTILDMSAMKHGVRKEIWHGWGWTPEKRKDYKSRKSELEEAARKQLAAFSIFIAEVGTEPRILERIEATIMNTLYKNDPPFCDIPDRGMQLAPRWKSESPIKAFMRCAVELYGIPKQLEI